LFSVQLHQQLVLIAASSDWQHKGCDSYIWQNYLALKYMYYDRT